MLQVVIYGLEDRPYQAMAQTLPFFIDIGIATPRKVNPFERACFAFLGFHNGCCAPLSLFVYQQCLSGIELFYIFQLHVHHGLNNRAFRCQHYNLVVGIIEGRTYTPGIAYTEGLAASGKSTYHVASVPLGTAFPEHIG